MSCSCKKFHLFGNWVKVLSFWKWHFKTGPLNVRQVPSIRLLNELMIRHRKHPQMNTKLTWYHLTSHNTSLCYFILNQQTRLSNGTSKRLCGPSKRLWEKRHIYPTNNVPMINRAYRCMFTPNGNVPQNGQNHLSSNNLPTDALD